MTSDEKRAAAIQAATTFYANRKYPEETAQNFADKILHFINTGEWKEKRY